MNERDYQTTAESLIANAGQTIQEQSLDGQYVFDSVEELCESSEGGQHFVEATMKIEQEPTKIRLTAGLRWVYDSVTAMALDKEANMELIKPFQLACIGLTVAIMLWIVDNPFEKNLGFLYLSIAGFNVICSTFVLRHLSKGRDKNRKFSARVKSLLDSLRSVGVS